MNAIVVGAGKVGSTIAEQLSAENYNITVIDHNAMAVNRVCDSIDAMGVVGNGMDYKILDEAGVKYADFFIAMTGSDELNLLLCLMAHQQSSECKTVARVRDPIFKKEQREFLRSELGISKIVNPEYEVAKKISNLILNPSADEVETFARDKIELLSAKITEKSSIINTPIKEAFRKSAGKLLVCAIERNGEVIIPDGEEILYPNDKISFVTSSKNAGLFFKRAGISNDHIKHIMIVGGSRVAYYLAKRLNHFGCKIKIIEKDEEKCDTLDDLLDGHVSIIKGDATEENVLLEERIDHSEAFVSLTNIDEENVMLSLFAHKRFGLKTITKVNKLSYDMIAKDLNIGQIVNPKLLTAEEVLSFAKSIENANGSNVQSISNIVEGKAYAMEFTAKEGSKVIGVPLSELSIKDNVRLCCISRGKDFIIPSGKDEIRDGDSVIVVTKDKKMNDLADILRG